MEQTNALLNAIPGQIIRHIEEEGIHYNMIIAGEGYSGKSSLICHLFGLDGEAQRDEMFFHEVCDMACTTNPLGELIDTPSLSSLDKTSITITGTRVTLQHKNTKVYLTIYEVSNIGDSVSCDADWVPIRNLILNRYEEHHMEEEKGTPEKDKRIHFCLYLMMPRAVPREIDIETMKELGKITNVIPVISKADTLSLKEYKTMKESVFSSLVAHQVQVFDSILVDECKKVVELSFMPLKYFTPNRMYSHTHPTQKDPGTEIGVFRDLLLSRHAIDLIETTEKFYESYRRSKLIVEMLTSSESGLDDHFKRAVVLEEAKLKALSKRIEEKKKTYHALISHHKSTIPEELL